MMSDTKMATQTIKIDMFDSRDRLLKTFEYESVLAAVSEWQNHIFRCVSLTNHRNTFEEQCAARNFVFELRNIVATDNVDDLVSLLNFAEKCDNWGIFGDPRVFAKNNLKM